MIEELPFQGKLIIFTAPSGAGKTTIVRHLLKHFDELDFSVSATNRNRRHHEKEGRDYYFLSTEEFKEKIDNEEFLEWEEVYENQFYGTLKSEIRRLWEKEKHIIFDIDVRGAKSIKRVYKDQALAVFIKPPSPEILFERLKNRKTETAKSLKKRITRAKKELKYEDKFDMVLINDELDRAFANAIEIVENFITAKKEESS